MTHAGRTLPRLLTALIFVPWLMFVTSLALALPAGLKAGDLVLGRYKSGAHWYAARLKAVAGDSVSLAYLDGDQETLTATNVRPFDWKATSRVECNWEGRGTYYPAIASAVKGETITVRYIEDGVVETTKLVACREVAGGAPAATGAGAGAASAPATGSGGAPATYSAPTNAPPPQGNRTGPRYGPMPPAGTPSSDTRVGRRVADTPDAHLLKGPIGFECPTAKEIGPFFPGDCVGMFEGIPMSRRRAPANGLLRGFAGGKALVNVFNKRRGTVDLLQLDPKLLWDGRFIARIDGWKAQREEILQRFFTGWGKDYIWQLYRRHPMYAELDGRSETSHSGVMIEDAPKLVAHWQAITQACAQEYKDFQDPRGGYMVRSLRDDLGLLCELVDDLPSLKASYVRYHAAQFLDEWQRWGRNMAIATVRIHDYDSSLQPKSCEKLMGRQVNKELVAAIGQDDGQLRQTVYQSAWGEPIRVWGEALGVDPLKEPEVVAALDQAAAILKAQTAKQIEDLPPAGWCATQGKPTDVEQELRAQINRDWPGATIEKMAYVSSRWIDTTTITGYLVRKSDLKIVKTIRERTSTSKHGGVLVRTKGGQCVYGLFVATRYDQGKGLRPAVVEALIPHLVACP